MPTTDSTSSASTATAGNKTHEHCDLCYEKDGFREMKLLTCPDCGVAFHGECYGVHFDTNIDNIDTQTLHKQEFKCAACRSVGATVEGRDHTGRLHVIKQPCRPTECSLCSVDEGTSQPHPMHPLYDNHGASGKQIVLLQDEKRKKPARLAWVHTLCAMSISSHSSTGGCVYGCNAAGKSTTDNDDKDEQVKNAATAFKRDMSVHHFVFCHKGKEKDAPESLWTKTIRERQALKCTLCGANDRNDGTTSNNVSYRIPVQCSANDPAELENFKGSHNGLRGKPCFVPVHVGCAQWHKNDAQEYPSVTRVYFFPGTGSDGIAQAQTTSDNAICKQPVVNIFCDIHARDLQVAKKQQTASTTGAVPAAAAEKVTARAANTSKPPLTSSVPTKVAAAKATPATNKSANNKLTTTTTGTTTTDTAPDPTKQHDIELCRKMVQDLVQYFRLLKNNKQRNRVRVQREGYWKRQSHLPLEEFKVMWGLVKERVTEILVTEETMVAAAPTTGEKNATPEVPNMKRNSSKIPKAVALDYPGDLEQHRELGDAMFRNAVTAMENIDIADGAAVKTKMSESRKSSRKSAKNLTLEKFRELWSLVKNAVADECGFRYAKPADISAGNKDSATAQASVSVGSEDVAERNDTREKQGAQAGLPSEATEVESAEASNAQKKSQSGGASNTREKQGARGVRSKVTEVKKAEVSKKRRVEGIQSEITEAKSAEPSNAPKRRRLGGVSESKLQDYGINQKEEWYHEMVTGIQEGIMKPNAVGAPGGLESIVAEHKKRWMKQLGIPNSQFRAIWERVTQKIKSFKATPIPTTTKDWSFLVVGKNYNPDGIDFKTWDTYEELASDPEE